MAKPGNTAPPRPPSVPPDARCDPREPGFEWVLGAVDAEGRRHGTYRSWTRVGLLHGECTYDHGRIHGKNIIYHPDGTVASEADWVNGVVMDSVFHRSDVPSPEPFAQAAPRVWSVRYYTRDGKTNYTIRYFARDGSECGPDGAPLPPRPRTVTAEARWFPDIERWVDGEIERGTNTQVGRWRWWSKDGVLRHEEQRDARGEATRTVVYRDDGTLEKQTMRDDAGEVRELYYDDGTLSTRYKSDARGRSIYKGSWLPDGTLDEEQVRTYADGSGLGGDQLASVTERGAGGVRVFEARREGPAMASVLYHPDGKTLAATGLVEGGQLRGTWRLFDARGVLRREVDVSPLAIEHEPSGLGLAWMLGEALYVADERTLATPPELAGIDAEPWATTPGAYDADVERFPGLARALVSTDPLIASYAYNAIAGEILHQGAVYPATARILPYLARLLANPAADRAGLLALIHDVAEAVMSPPEPDPDAGVSPDERAAREGTFRALASAWRDVHARFATADPDDRRRILAIARRVPAAKPDIIALARYDADPATRACALDCLVAMRTFTASDAQPSLHDKDVLVRAAAAIALASRLGTDAPRDTVHALDDAIRNWRELERRHADLPFTEGIHVLAAVALAAGSIGTADARSLVVQLCNAFDEVDGRSAIPFGRGLLMLAFGKGARPFAKRFLEILDTLARSRQFWVFDVDALELLAGWNLPGSRRELAALVNELLALPEPEAKLHDRMFG